MWPNPLHIIGGRPRACPRAQETFSAPVYGVGYAACADVVVDDI